MPGQRQTHLSTQLSISAWSIEAGQTASGWLTLINNGSRTATFTVHIEGVAESWATIDPAQVTLSPGATATVSIAITPPRHPTSRAGTYPLKIKVSSPDYLAGDSQHEATLIVHPFYGFAVEELTPKTQAISRFKASAVLSLSLINRSNCEALFRVTGVDVDGQCRFEFQPPGDTADLAHHADFWLAPNEGALIPVRLTPPPRPLVSLGKQPFHFTLTSTILAGQQTSYTLAGQVKSPPLIEFWLLSLLSVCLIALLILTTPVENLWQAEELSRVVNVNPTPEQSPETQSPAAEKSSAFASDSTETIPAIIASESDLPDTAASQRGDMSYEEMFQEIAPQYGLDWQLLAELAYQESLMNPWAVGRDFDMGMMQIIPRTWDEWAPKVGVTDPFDPYSNILVGAAYLAYMRDYAQARGRTEMYWMLVGYNWGPDNLDRLFANNGSWAQIPATQRNYSLSIMQATANSSRRWQKKDALTLKSEN